MASNNRASILLPHVINQNAQNDPHGLIARVPAGSAYTDGFTDVTKSEFAKAIDYTAHLIKQNFGEGQDFETLAYVGPSDLRYNITVVAAIKAGYKAFLPSPRNSKAAQVSLLHSLACRKIIVTDPPAPCVPLILQSVSMQTMTLPTQRVLLDIQDVQVYPYEKSFDQVKDQPVFALHTSGSTGVPKPMVYTHDFIAKIIGVTSLSPPDGFRSMFGYASTGPFLNSLPSFHLAGLAFSLLVPCYHSSLPIYFLPGPPPNLDSLVSAMSNTDVEYAFIPPVILDELGKHPDLLDIVASHLKYMFFLGGAAPKVSGDVVAKRIPVYQILGSSECGCFPLIHPEEGYDNANDWNYMLFDPNCKLEMRHRVDDLYEMVVVRCEEVMAFSPVFAQFPDATEFKTHDLFRPHPSKPGLWAFSNRLDDVIVFLNGEKTNPVTFEEEVISHPEIRAALVVGAQRMEAALLVELAVTIELSESEKTAVINRIWPTVEKANEATPAHARVSKDKILLIDAKAPMLRAGKGTVQRKPTLDLYAAKIEELYVQEESVELEDTPKGDGVRSLIRNAVADMLIFDDVDFFRTGMDSLGVLKLQRLLKRCLPGVDVPTNIIYSNTSVNKLAQALQQTAKKDKDIFSVKDSKPGSDETSLHASENFDHVLTLNPPEIKARSRDASPSTGEDTIIAARHRQERRDSLITIIPTAEGNGVVTEVPTSMNKNDIEHSAESGDVIYPNRRSTQEVDRQLETFSKQIDAMVISNVDTVPRKGNGQCILLTGTTGSLGSHILHNLLARPNVTHIYCFNRTSDAKERQVIISKTRNLTSDFPSERVTFVDGNLADPNFGLLESEYDTLLSNVTNIIHNAWPVNFNLPLTFFTEAMAGVVSLIRFCLASRFTSSLQFCSSISSALSFVGDIVPEEVITDLSAPGDMGYGQSKYISERLLDHASRKFGIRTGFVRIGQVAGAAKNRSGWNKQEWLPSLVISSAWMGLLPRTLGDMAPREANDNVDWIPVDHLADVLVELTLDNHGTDQCGERGAHVYQVVHPKPVQWSSLILSLQTTLNTLGSPSKKPMIVSYTEWLLNLMAKSAEAENDGSVEYATLIQMNPALKLLDFYQSLQKPGTRGARLPLAMGETLKASETLRNLEPLKDEWVTGWVQEWITTEQTEAASV